MTTIYKILFWIFIASFAGGVLFVFINYGITGVNSSNENWIATGVWIGGLLGALISGIKAYPNQ